MHFISRCTSRFSIFLIFQFLATSCAVSAGDRNPPNNDSNHLPAGIGPSGTQTISPQQTVNQTPVGAQNQQNATRLDVIGQVPLASNENLPLGLPQEVTTKKEVIISRHQYALSWNNDTRQINWASWTIESTNFGSVGRRDRFAVDKDLQDYLSQFNAHAVTPTDYEGTCLDRGHQVPSGDRTATVDDNAATFMMSNIIPQTAHLNRVAWEHLEAHLRSVISTTRASKLLIVSGPIFGSNPGHIGPNKDIPVPASNFKVIVQLGGADGSSQAGSNSPIMAVVMPNVTSKGTDPLVDHAQACADSGIKDVGSDVTGSDDWKAYLTTLAEVERQAGVHLFTKVPQSVHDAWSQRPPQPF